MARTAAKTGWWIDLRGAGVSYRVAQSARTRAASSGSMSSTLSGLGIFTRIAFSFFLALRLRSCFITAGSPPALARNFSSRAALACSWGEERRGREREREGAMEKQSAEVRMEV